MASAPRIEVVGGAHALARAMHASRCNTMPESAGQCCAAAFRGRSLCVEPNVTIYLEPTGSNLVCNVGRPEYACAPLGARIWLAGVNNMALRDLRLVKALARLGEALGWYVPNVDEADHWSADMTSTRAQVYPAGARRAALPSVDLMRLAVLGHDFTPQERQRLLFLRWLYLRGSLTEFPESEFAPHADTSVSWHH